MEDILKLAAEKFKGALGGGTGQSLATGAIILALQNLLTGKDGKLDLGSLISNLDGQGLMNIAQSWLGDGANAGISAEAIQNLFGGKLDSFASELGIKKDEAVSGLQSAIPEVVDKSSSDGNLLDQAGGIFKAVKGLF